MWAGIAIALVLCIGLVLVLQAIGNELPFRQRELMEGVLGIVAVAGVTYMIIWMRQHARGLKAVLEGQAASALLTGSLWTLVGLAFFAVLREGVETTIFMLAAFNASADPAATGTGAVLGLVTAIVLGYLIYKGGVRLNLARFFKVTSLLLVFIAAGLLAKAMHDLGTEAGFIAIGQAKALDLTWLVRPGTVSSALVTGMLGIQPEPTVGETAIWLLYLIPMAAFVLWPQRQRPVKATPTGIGDRGLPSEAAAEPV
jgi:high-affinity iron transporter